MTKTNSTAKPVQLLLVSLFPVATEFGAGADVDLPLAGMMAERQNFSLRFMLDISLNSSPAAKTATSPFMLIQ